MQRNITCVLGLQSFRGQGVSPLHTKNWPCTAWVSYMDSVHTTQLKSTFRTRWLASSEVISQILFISEQWQKNKMACVGILSQINLLFALLVIQLVWYILKQLFTSMSVKVVDIYRAAKVNNRCLFLWKGKKSTSVSSQKKRTFIIGHLSMQWNVSISVTV